MISYGEKHLNANLFSAEVDEGRTRGYNHKTFDARNPDDWIDFTLAETTSQWQQFLNLFRAMGGKKGEEDFLVAKDILPIQEVEPSIFNVLKTEEIEDKLFVHSSNIEELKNYTLDAALENKKTYLLRIGVTEYQSVDLECHPMSGDPFGKNYEDMYIARDTAFLDFDILYLGFVKRGIETIIPVVASPIDIYPTITPPPKYQNNNLIWWLVGIIVGVTAVGVAVAFVEKKLKG